MTVLQADNVSKHYHMGTVTVSALAGVSLVVNKGEFVAIMGPSGSGKSTLLHLLGGLDGPSDGEITLAGQPLSKLTDNQITIVRRRKVGFIFQFYNLLPVLSAVENVELPLLVSGTSPAASRERALASLDRVGLREWQGHRPAQLSGGQRQRVTIARALVNDPAIVWADEPTGDLDSENAAEIVELMRRLNAEQGLTFLIVTHDIAVGRRTDRIVRMLDGLVVEEQRLEVPHVLAGHAA
jgi:putative ABC transport system ATP-binding protein